MVVAEVKININRSVRVEQWLRVLGHQKRGVLALDKRFYRLEGGCLLKFRPYTMLLPAT